MKNLFFCLCFLFLSIAGYCQSARIEFLSEKDALVLHNMQRCEVKAGVPYVLNLEGQKMYDESFIISFKMLDLFLEQGEVLKVKLVGKEIEIIDDGRMCAAQNKLMCELNALKREYWYKKFNKKLIPEGQQKWNLESVCDSMRRCVEQFRKSYPTCSKNFDKVIQTELKYFKILEKNCSSMAKVMFGDVSENVVQQLSEVVKDSKDDRNVYSVSYWQVVRCYSSYLRIADPDKLLGDPNRYYENEIKLTEYFESGAVRERLLFEHLKEIMFWAKPEDKGEIDKCIAYLRPAYVDVIHELWADLEKQFQENNLKPSNVYPKLSGEDTTGKVVDLNSFKGSWVFLDIWATWCIPCCGEIPFVSAMEKKLEGEEVVFLSISVDEDKRRDAWIEKIQENGMRGVQLRWLQKRDELYQQLGITGIPYFAIIDPEGKLFLNKLPNVSTGIIYRLLEDILENR